MLLDDRKLLELALVLRVDLDLVIDSILKSKSKVENETSRAQFFYGLGRFLAGAFGLSKEKIIILLAESSSTRLATATSHGSTSTRVLPLYKHEAFKTPLRVPGMLSPTLNSAPKYLLKNTNKSLDQGNMQRVPASAALRLSVPSPMGSSGAVRSGILNLRLGGYMNSSSYPPPCFKYTI